MSTPIQIVPARPEHHAIILDSFWRDYRRSPVARGVPPSVLTAKMSALLASPAWSAVVATPEDDADTVLGFLVYRDAQTVGWLQTRRPWRGTGVARALLASAGVARGTLACAFLPPEVARLADARGYTLRFRPYLPDVAADEMATRIAELMDVG